MMLKKLKSKKINSPVIIIIFTILLLFLIALIPKYYDSADIGDYAGTAKFFAGKQQAKLRASHSIVYGLMHSPFVRLTNSFILMKVSSVLWLSLLILSIYYISKKNKKTLLLFITTPIIWYMAPWIISIQLCSLLFLWGYYFIKKYDKQEKLKYLFYSGLLIGLAWAFWDAMIYFAIIFIFCFLYNKKTSHFIFFIFILFVGTLPKLLVDQVFFGFAFYSIFKHFSAMISGPLYGGVYNIQGVHDPLNILLALIITPFFSYLFFTKKVFLKYKKTIIFLTLSLFVILYNTAQIRYLLILVPIIILILGEILNEKQFKLQIIIFLVLTLLVINPYLIQIKYQINGKEFDNFIRNLPNLELNSQFKEDLILKDLNQIAKEHPNEVFVVGPNADDFQYLAHLYWGSKIKEFMSIQDYRLFMSNKTTLASETFCSSSKPWNRRDICITVELRKTIDDRTDYEKINLGIGMNKPIDIPGFAVIEKYNLLYLSKKE